MSVGVRTFIAIPKSKKFFTILLPAGGKEKTDLRPLEHRQILGRFAPNTGMVTLRSQDLSEFALHVRAFLGLPIPRIRLRQPSASAVILPEGHSRDIRYRNLAAALGQPDTDLRLFDKPEIAGRRRMGVALASGDSVDETRSTARRAVAAVQVELR